MCSIGKVGFPIFLSNGQAPRRVGLGFNSTRLEQAELKVQIINNVVCLTQGARILFEFGANQADAELVLKVIKHFNFDQLTSIGDPSSGGLRFLARTK
jgi:hypothetical protein